MRKVVRDESDESSGGSGNERKVSYFILVFFGAGKFPFAQGTFASALSFLLIVPLKYFLFSFKLWGVFESLFLVFIFLFSVRLSKEIPRFWRKKDPSEVVLDEVLGMFVSLFLIPPSPQAFFIAFIFFRIFDIVKIPPANFFDDMEDPAGVMFDDVVAGIYANLTTRIALYFIMS